MQHPATPAGLRSRIAIVLPAEIMQHEIQGICDRLGMPPVQKQVWGYDSKSLYVMQRLAGVPAAELMRIAREIVDEFGDDQLRNMIASSGIRGTDGVLKNLIFAGIGARPRIVSRDAIENIIEIVEGADRCLVYDRPLGPVGLSWDSLVSWWEDGAHAYAQAEPQALHSRLARSLTSRPKLLLFEVYCERYEIDRGGNTPALLPQVYLHYDPYTKHEMHLNEGQELVRQRMDFLLLPKDRRRIVIDVNGPASPGSYVKKASEDRRLQLAGYEVFRFGADELRDEASARSAIEAFFNELLGT